MRDVRGLNSFANRVNFSSSILNRNKNSKLIYKPKLSLIYKKENEVSTNQINHLTNKTFNTFFDNLTVLNRYMSNNPLNIYSIKNLLIKKNFFNRFLSSFKTQQKSSFVNNSFSLINKNINDKKLEVSKIDDFYINKHHIDKGFNFSNQTYISANINESIKKEFILQNRNEKFIFKENSDEEQKIKDIELEKRVIKRLEEKIDEKISSRKFEDINISTINTNHIVNQREDKALTNRIYESVIKKWDKENKRRGYLYE